MIAGWFLNEGDADFGAVRVNQPNLGTGALAAISMQLNATQPIAC